MRPSIDEYYIEMAQLVAKRGTCARRQVGCVLVDQRKRVLSTGFNGVPAGHPHCTDTPCGGEGGKSGEGLNLCRAAHAEQAALLHCPDVMKIHTAYVTTSPCVDCTRLLLLSSCQRIVFLEEYPHGLSKHWWTEAGRLWSKYDG